MVGREKVDVANLLMTSNISMSLLQFLQASPQARRDVSALISVPRARKGVRRMVAGLVTAPGPRSFGDQPSPHGSFFH
jgi:hypothetical protein